MHGSTWTKRQKVLIFLTIITFAVLIWQIYSLVKGDLLTTHRPSTTATLKTQYNPTSTSSLTTDRPQPDDLTSPNSSLSASNQPAGSPTDSPQVMKQLPDQIYQSRNDLAPNQQEYMRYSREFELAKMQRRLLEEQVAIVNARKSIADTEHQTNKLLGAGSESLNFDKDEWRLTFLSHYNQKWHATLVHDGDYHNVTEGMKLLDGTKILQINKFGVKFEYHGFLKQLSFAGIKTLSRKNLIPQNTTTASTAIQSDAAKVDTQDAHALSAASTQNIAAPPMTVLPESNPSNTINPSSTQSKTPAVPSTALPNFIPAQGN